MARSRKHSHKKVIKLTKRQIMMIEDEWYAKYNKTYYKTSTNN